jgi:hypothetical protein
MDLVLVLDANPVVEALGVVGDSADELAIPLMVVALMGALLLSSLFVVY